MSDDDILINAIPIRPGKYVRVIGLPFDLTKKEAERIARIILAYATPEMPSSIMAFTPPAHCIDKDSCHRHGECMYAGCLEHKK